MSAHSPPSPAAPPAGRTRPPSFPLCGAASTAPLPPRRSDSFTRCWLPSSPLFSTAPQFFANNTPEFHCCLPLNLLSALMTGRRHSSSDFGRNVVAFFAERCRELELHQFGHIPPYAFLCYRCRPSSPPAIACRRPHQDSIEVLPPSTLTPVQPSLMFLPFPRCCRNCRRSPLSTGVCLRRRNIITRVHILPLAVAPSPR
jgi:hypothetical protein